MNVQPAPDFTLEHVEGHQVSLSEFRGRPVVIAFATREAAGEMRNQIDVLRASYDYQQLPVLSVADMRGVPRPARVVAKRLLKSSYNDSVKSASRQVQEAGKRVPPGSELVIMLPDWEGSVADSFAVPADDHEGTMILIDGEGYPRAQGHGTQAGQQMLAAIGS